MNMKLNNKGFTLIELLAAMVILAAIMAIAVPNVLGILNNSKADAYVEDAKKLLSLAEYKFRANPSFRPPQNQCTVMSLNYLDNSEFDNAPNNGKYDKTNSYVIIVNQPTAAGKSQYLYYVTIDEILTDGSHRGIAYKSYEQLYGNEPGDLIQNGGSGELAKPDAAISHVSCNSIYTSL